VRDREGKEGRGRGEGEGPDQASREIDGPDGKNN